VQHLTRRTQRLRLPPNHSLNTRPVLALHAAPCVPPTATTAPSPKRTHSPRARCATFAVHGLGRATHHASAGLHVAEDDRARPDSRARVHAHALF